MQTDFRFTKEKLKKVRNDSTSTFRGIIYQFYVALEKCFDLEPNQSLFIEHYGDVAIIDTETIKNNVSVEVKLYAESDEITENHHNFLNTIYNWLQPKFQVEKFSSLILYTTQTIKTEKLSKWNELTGEERYELIYKSYKDYIEKHSTPTPKSRIAQNVKQMAYVLGYKDGSSPSTEDQQKRKHFLVEIFNRISLEVFQDNFEKLHNRLCNTRVPYTDNREEYIDSLVSSLINPERINNNWEMSYEEFQNIKELYTKKFCPSDKLKVDWDGDFKPEVEVYKDKLYITQLKDINYFLDEYDERDFASREIQTVNNLTSWVKRNKLDGTDEKNMRREAQAVWKNSFDDQRRLFRDDPETFDINKQAVKLVSDIVKKPFVYNNQTFDIQFSNGFFLYLSDFPLIGWRIDWESLYK